MIFGKEFLKKKFKFLFLVVERKYFFNFEGNEDFERKIKFKNDVFIVNECFILLFVFYLLIGKLLNE